MAFTVSTIVNTVMGNARIKTIRVTADGATGTCDMGPAAVKDTLVTIDNAASAATMNLPVVANNKGVSGTAIVGSIALTNCVSGDIYRLLVIQ